MTRWLITGGCGFIGSSLIRRLLRAGNDNSIRIVDNLSVGAPGDLPRAPRTCSAEAADWSGLELIVGDIGDGALARRAAQGADVIVHLAANTGVLPSIESPMLDCTANVIGTLNYLEAARHARVSRLVFASSGAPAGNQPPPIHEEIAPHPMSPYGASKLAGEGYCSAYWHSYKLETVALRFGNVYGPGSLHKGSVVAKFIRRAMAGEPLEIYGDGQQTRDFIFIDDLLDAIVAAASRSGVGGEIIQVATGTERTVGEVVEVLARVLREQRGIDVEITYGAERAGEMRRTFADISKARRLLGFEPRYQLPEGLARTVEYFLGIPPATDHAY